MLARLLSISLQDLLLFGLVNFGLVPRLYFFLEAIDSLLHFLAPILFIFQPFLQSLSLLLEKPRKPVWTRRRKILSFDSLLLWISICSLLMRLIVFFSMLAYSFQIVIFMELSQLAQFILLLFEWRQQDFRLIPFLHFAVEPLFVDVHFGFLLHFLLKR